MNGWNAIGAGAVLCSLAAGSATAEGTTYTGLSFTTDYVSGGLTQNDGKPALQGYVEHDLDNGLFAGLWFSQVDFSALGATDNVEIDAYVGYRGVAGKFSYDITYYRYYYDEAGFDSDELWAKLNYSVSDQVRVGANLRRYFHGIFEDEFLYGPTFSVGLGEMTSADGDLTANTLNDDLDWSFGLRRQLADSLSAQVRYYDSNFDDPRVAVSLSWDTDFTSLFAR